MDLVDLVVFVGQWLQTGDDLAADIYPLRGDGIVNLLDFAILVDHWLEGSGK